MTPETHGSGTLRTLSGCSNVLYERPLPRVFWLAKHCVHDARWFAGYWWCVGRWVDVPSEGDPIESSVIVHRVGQRADLVELVTQGCAEPAWRKERVWHWGDVEPVRVLLDFVASMSARAQEDVRF
jgi:hypothetical protein